MSYTNGNSKPSTSSQYLAEVSQVLMNVPNNQIELLIESLFQAQKAGHTIFLFGNGGSAALASHIACDLGKGTSELVSRRIRVLSLTDNVPLITAWANDTAYEHVFAEQLSNFVAPGDLTFAISGSGNSPNVLNGLSAAKLAGSTTVGLTGFQGGKMKALCDVCVVVPSENMQIIEDAHTAISHAIFIALCARLQPPVTIATVATVTAPAHQHAMQDNFSKLGEA